MILNNEYLSDEALEQLISEVKANELIPAPPELKDSIFYMLFEDLHTEAVEQETEVKETTIDVPNPAPEIRKQKQREFVEYSFRVGMSVVAAVAFIFIMPYLPVFGDSVDVLQTTESREEIRYEYPTREEVLNDTNIFRKVFGDNGILEESNYLNIFIKKDGGQ